jgi:tetratricopeptide (TPR) repeat protein
MKLSSQGMSMSEWKRTRLWLQAALAWLLAAVGSGCRREGPDDLWYRATVDFDAGRLAEAEADFVQLARIRRLTVAERVVRSHVASDRGRIDEALAVLADPSGPTKGPLAAVIATRRGELELERYQFRAAEVELIHALALDPKSIDARRRLIRLYTEQGRSTDIAARVSSLVSSATLDFLDLFYITLARHQPVDRAEQAEVLARAVQTDPGDRTSRLALAECLRRLGRLDQAESTLELLNPSEPEVRSVLALIALDRGDVSRAEAVAAGDSDADSHPALARLRGRLALARDDAPAAVRQFRIALKAAPDDRDTHFGLAQALSLAGQPEAARPHAETALAQDRLEWLLKNARAQESQNDPATLQAIAAACLALNRHHEARAWYRLALSHDPHNDQLKNALSRLR